MVGILKMRYEAIILCGGKGWRLKPDTWTPKPLLKISTDETLLDIWVSAGHYVFSKKLVEEYFPDEGDFERKAMQKIVNDKFLNGLKYRSDWLTVNTIKDLAKIREYLETRQTKRT